MATSKYKVRAVQKLRRDGYSLREISLRTGVPIPTVHRHVRDLQLDGHHPEKPIKKRSSRNHGFKTDPGRYIGVKIGRRYGGLLVHLSDIVICPVCQEEGSDVVFCLDCGRCWLADCGHGSELVEDGHKGFSLGELRRKKGDGELHVFPLQFKKD